MYRVKFRAGLSKIARPARQAFIVLPAVAVLVGGIFMVTPEKKADAAIEACKVGIAVDRSGSVAIRDPRNPYKLKQELKSLFTSNKINNPNIELSFWSFGTAASGYQGTPPGRQPIDGIGAGSDNPDYPYYVYSGSGTQEVWLNSASNSAARISNWNQQVDRIPFFVNRDAFVFPDWVADQGNTPPAYSDQFNASFRPNWEVNRTGSTLLGSTESFRGINFSLRDAPSSYTGDPANGPPYYGRYMFDDPDVPAGAVDVDYQSNNAGGTNWEAGLGRNNSGWLGSWGGINRVDEANVVILFTDAIDPDNSDSWYNNEDSPEPNLPADPGLATDYRLGYPSTTHYTPGLSWAHFAADQLRLEGKTVVVVSYDQAAESSQAYLKIADNTSNIFTLDGDNSSNFALGDLLNDIAEQKCSELGARPYLKVYGNDARAGGKFGDEVGVCSATTPAPANVRTFAENLTTGNAWAGASVQHAVSATGDIDQFFSAGRRNGLAGQPRPIHDLSIGNYYNNSRIAGTDYGGDSGMNRCIPDYYEIAQANGAPSAPADIGGSKSGKSVQIRSGNIHISSNIQYSDTTWSDVSEIPSYTLVVKGGDIYINSSVQRLDGTYIAMPDANGVGGRIFTCANTINSLYDPGSTMKTACDNKLTINGAFIAKQVRFLRTNGDLGDCTQDCINETPGSGNVAEEFNFSQEAYLTGAPALLRDASTGRYNSIISLPPIL